MKGMLVLAALAVTGATAGATVASAAAPAPAKHVERGALASPPASDKGSLSVVDVHASSITGLQVKSKTFAAANGQQTRGQVGCGQTKVPVGGGVLIYGTSVFANVNSSIPSARKWIVDVNNASGADTRFTVYAMCAKRPAGYQIVTASYTDGTFQRTIGNAYCPAGTVPYGGGALSSSVSTAVNMNSDETQTPNSTGWRVDMLNNTSTTGGHTVYAICGARPPLWRLVTSPEVINPAYSQTGANITCPAGTVAIGGGIVSGNNLATVNSTYPLGQTWRVYGNNASSSQNGYYGTAICA